MPTTMAWERSVDVAPGRRGSVELESGIVGAQEQHALLASERAHGYSDAPQDSLRAKSTEMDTIDLSDPGYLGDHDATSLQKKKSRYILLPESTFRKIWVQMQMVIALYIIWVTPIRVGFDMQAQGFWFWMEGVINIFFWADLFMNFFVAYENPLTNELVTDHKKIAERYLKGWFIIDLLATFPSDYIVKLIQGTWGCSWRNNCYFTTTAPASYSTNVVLIALLRLMRIFRIFWILKNFNNLSISTLLGKLQYELIGFYWIISVLELLIVLLFLGHVTGCFFYMFGGSQYWRTQVEKGLIEEGIMSTWVLDKFGGYYEVEVPDRYNSSVLVATDQIARDPQTGWWYKCSSLFNIVSCPTCRAPPFRCESYYGFVYRYITAMYWAFTTMTTVGYGDIVAFITAEKVWCIVTELVGGFFLSFCFGRMANVVGKMDAQKSARAEQMEDVTRFLKDVELPKPLTRKVMDFFRTNVRSVKPYDRTKMIERLPFDLRSKVTNYLYLPTIKNVPVLQRFAEDEVFLTEFCAHLQPYHCSAETFVYQKGESHGDVFILLQGDMHVLDSDRRTLLFKIPEGRLFGESVVLRRMEGHDKARRTENVFCKTECDMLTLTCESIIIMCEHYPQLRKDLQRLNKSRQARMNPAFGRPTSPLMPPVPRQSDGHSATSEDGSLRPHVTPSAMQGSDSSHLMSLPGSGNSMPRTQPGNQAGAQPALPNFPDAQISSQVSASRSETHLLGLINRDDSIGYGHAIVPDDHVRAELTLLRKQVEQQQDMLQKQMQLQLQILQRLVPRDDGPLGNPGVDIGAGGIGEMSMDFLVGQGYHSTASNQAHQQPTNTKRL